MKLKFWQRGCHALAAHPALVLLSTLVTVLLLSAPLVPAAADYVTKNYMQPNDWYVGGTLNIKTGGKITVNGADVTSSVSGNAVAGVASGYKIATGEAALTGTNPKAVTTGLASIASCTLTIKSATAPTTTMVTYGASSGTLNIYGWMPTDATHTALIASTGTETVGWSCRGA